MASLREKVQECTKGKCDSSNPPAKVKLNDALKKYVSDEYAKLKVKPTRNEALSKVQDLANKAAATQSTDKSERKANVENKYFSPTDSTDPGE